MPPPDRLAALTLAAIERLPGTPGSAPWFAAFERTLARAHQAAFMTGIAERFGVAPRGLSRAERADVTRAVQAQLAYLAGFRQAAGTLSEAQILARAKLYAAAPVRQSYYAARWGAWDIPDELLPGNQTCQANCKCEITIRDHGDGTGTLTRTMGAEARHCTTCPPLAGDHDVQRKAA